VYRKHGYVHISEYSDSGYADDQGDRKSTTGYRTFAGGNLMTWRSKKQDVVSRSSVNAKYRAMAHITCEMLWLKNLLMELDLDSLDQCLYIVIISLPSILSRIQCFMKGPNILRLTIMLSEMLGPRR